MNNAEAEVEVSTLLLNDGATLGAFLYHPDPDGRIEAETVLYREGASFIIYPHVADIARINGSALVADSTLTIAVGTLYVVTPLEVSSREIEAAKRVALYLFREPFEAGDRTEKTVLAASMPLDILERGTK